MQKELFFVTFLQFLHFFLDYFFYNVRRVAKFIQLTFGWIKEKYTHYPAFHIEITLEGKIYIHQNRTDVLIDELLMEQGVPEIDILDGMDETFPRKLADSKAA